MAIAALGTALLAGCSSDGNGDLRMMFDVARSIVDPPVTSISLKQASAVPHATMGVRIGGGSEILTILAAFEPGQLWVTGKQLAIVTRRGRIVRTAGLENNLTKLTADEGTDFSPIDIARGQTSRSRWTVQLDDLGFSEASMECSAHAVRREPVVSLGKKVDTERVEEQCSSPALRWAFTNVYWVSPTTGLVWKSIQNVHPKGDPLTTELLRPPEKQD